MQRLVIIEDDEDIAHSIQYFLEREGGFAVDVIPDGERGLEHVRQSSPDLLILDLNLPGVDGVEICRALRGGRETARLPIIMLTARVAEREKLFGLDVGADDYITKPFSLKELLARVRAVLRRSVGQGAPPPRIYRTEHLTLDETSREVTVLGKRVVLTRKEFDLLATLLRQRGRVFTREMLLERVWGYDHPGATRTVDVHVRQLRKKLGEPAADDIETVVGIGYRLRSST